MAGAGIVLLARFASTRLPGKALATIGGRSILEHCIDRLIRANVGPVIVATTTRLDDDVLVRAVRSAGVPVYRGAVNDVLGRTLAVADLFGFDPVIRATGDNPAVDDDGPRRVLKRFIAASGDYACEDGLPVGAAVEVISRDALARCAAEAESGADREHVTTLIKREPERYQRVPVMAPPRLRRPDLRFTVDGPADLAYIRRLFRQAGHDSPALSELIQAADAVAREVA